MATQAECLSVYRELAERYDQLGQVSMRDRFLMLAAAAALEAGQPAEAERLRTRLLQQNRHHMLRPYGSFEEAVGAADVRTYLNDLKANYPAELAAQLLGSLQNGNPPPPPRVTPRKSDRGPADPPAPLAPIPPTAPVVDPYAAAPAPPKPSWEAAIPYKVVDHFEETQPTPTPPPVRKPLAQPVPGRAARSAGETELPPMRPTVPVPRPRPVAAAAPLPVASPMPEPQPDHGGGGAWLCMLLMGVAAMAGVLLGAFTLARPFLPPGWLR